jgi:hypothetical protein
METNGQASAKTSRRRARAFARKRPTRPTVKRSHDVIEERRLSALSPPPYLSTDSARVWPPVSEPISVATQYRMKLQQERQRSLATVICGLVALATAFVFSITWLRFVL